MFNIEYLRGGYGKTRETPRQITDILNKNLKIFVAQLGAMIASITQVSEDATAAIAEVKKISFRDTAVTAHYTLLESDEGKYIEVDSADPVNITVPKDTFSKGVGITLEQSGAGRVTVIPEDVDVTLVGDNKSYGQNAIMTLVFKDINNVHIIGGDV